MSQKFNLNDVLQVINATKKPVLEIDIFKKTKDGLSNVGIIDLSKRSSKKN